MEKMIKKFVDWLKLNLASVLAIIQAVLKFLKEVLTAMINFLFPIIPNAVFQSVVLKVREVVNKIDEVVEKIKNWILPKLED